MPGGLQAYHGSAQHVRAAADRRERIAHAVACVQETQRALRAAGLEARMVTGAGTGTYENEAASGVYNELQAGSYIFMDADYARNLREDGGLFDAYQHALFVHATVMSAPASDRRVIDAGLKTFAMDAGMPTPWKLDGAVYHRPSDEHGILDVSACDQYRRAVRRSRWCRVTATRRSTCMTGRGHTRLAGHDRAWNASGRWRRGALCSEFVPRCCALRNRSLHTI